MATNAKRHASETDDLRGPSKRVNNIEKSISTLLVCVEAELQERKGIKEKLFSKWVQEGKYTSLHLTFTLYLSVERDIIFFPPIADPSLSYSIRDNEADDVPESRRLHYENLKRDKSEGKQIIEGIAVSLFQKYHIPCPWCSLLMTVLLSLSFQSKIVSSQNLAQYLPQGKNAIDVYTFRFC
jgi:hypothetical protein